MHLSGLKVCGSIYHHTHIWANGQKLPSPCNHCHVISILHRPQLSLYNEEGAVARLEFPKPETFSLVKWKQILRIDPGKNYEVDGEERLKKERKKKACCRRR